VKKTFRAQSRHTIRIYEVDRLPEGFRHSDTKGAQVYAAHNFDKSGPIFFHLARVGRQWLVWYRNGELWDSFGETVQEALDGAQRDGWLHTTRRGQ
jgi:hypothetical protein